jgi:hypothetical protein
MFGFYDPKSFERHDDHGRIDFIDAATGETRVIEIRTAGKAREISDALGAMSSDAGPMKEISGGVAIFEAGDGVLQDARKKIHPFRMDFDLDGFVLPIDGAARLLGVEIDGALIVQSMAFQPQLPIAELMPDLASTATP